MQLNQYVSRIKNMKNITCLNIKKALRKSVMLNKYKKNILTIFNVHINQVIKFIIKNFINLIMKKIVKNEHEVIITLINKTCNQSSINIINLNLSLIYIACDAIKKISNY